MQFSTFQRPAPAQQRGMSLIELMVAMVVAMAAVVVVMQVFKTSEGQRRTTTGGDDAQTIGAISLTVLQRDLRQAGQGMVNPSLLDCNLTVAAGLTVNNLAPLTINHATVAVGDAGSDTLLIAYGSSLGSPDGDRINTQTGANIYAVANAGAFRSNDRVIAAPPTRQVPCALQLTSVSAAPAAPNVTVAAGTAGVANGTLFNWGTTPRIVAYAVRGGRLTACDYLNQNCALNTAANWAEVADGIVSLRAQYGRDSSAVPDGIVDVYDLTTPATAAAWMCTFAARVVIVTRNSQLEQSDVTAVAPVWAGSATSPVTLSGDWKRFRYKTFETTVPLRNVAWSGVPTGC